jgi:hypothetical protein
MGKRYNMEEKSSISNFSMEGILNHFSAIITKLIVVIVIEAIILFLTIVGFLWYISLPVEEYSTEVDNGAGNLNYIGNDFNGDIDNGESKDNL